MVLITKLDFYAYPTILWHSYSYAVVHYLCFLFKFHDFIFTTAHISSSKSIYNKIKRDYKLNQILRPADANKPISFHFTAFAV